MYTCEVELGPLCYNWKENALGKLLGPDKAKALEEKLHGAKKAFEENFIEKLQEGKKGPDIEGLLKDAKNLATEAKEVAEDALEEAKHD